MDMSTFTTTSEAIYFYKTLRRCVFIFIKLYCPYTFGIHGMDGIHSFGQAYFLRVVYETYTSAIQFIGSYNDV